jgi:DUF4097 and DUF4098 domain-containing protein YvlB
MKTILKIILFLFFLFYFLTLNSLSAKEMEISKSFSGKKSVEINTVSGDCVVRTGNKNTIKVVLIYDYPQGCFEPEFLESGSTLILREDFTGSCRGRSLWKVTVPEKTKITFDSASGDLSIKGIKNDIEVETASGDIDLEKIVGDCEIESASGDLEVKNFKGKLDVQTASGDQKIKLLEGSLEIKSASGDVNLEDISADVEIKTASGDVEASNIKGKDISIRGASSDIEIDSASGEFEIKTASGEVEVDNIDITGDSEFKTASGTVEVRLKSTLKFDLIISSASGDAILDYNGNPIKGYFEFICKEDDGRIESPFKFDNVEEYYRYGQKYLKKSFTRKSKTPRIIIKTASGTAELNK